MLTISNLESHPPSPPPPNTPTADSKEVDVTLSLVHSNPRRATRRSFLTMQTLTAQVQLQAARYQQPCL